VKRLPSAAALGKNLVYRVSGLTECQALGKASFTECNILPGASSGKYCFAECPDKKHSAKPETLGKVLVSSGDG
jgi:hypothetical protein